MGKQEPALTSSIHIRIDLELKQWLADNQGIFTREGFIREILYKEAGIDKSEWTINGYSIEHLASIAEAKLEGKNWIKAYQLAKMLNLKGRGRSMKAGKVLSALPEWTAPQGSGRMRTWERTR